MGKQWLNKTIWKPVWLISTWEDGNPNRVVRRFCNVIPSGEGSSVTYNGNAYSLLPFIVDRNSSKISITTPAETVNELSRGLRGLFNLSLTNIEETALSSGRSNNAPFDSDALIYYAEFDVVERNTIKTGDIRYFVSPYYKDPNINKVYRRCPWEYRGPRQNGKGCGYSGGTVDDPYFGNVDRCSKSVLACTRRFPNSNNQPFGGAQVWTEQPLI